MFNGTARAKNKENMKKIILTVCIILGSIGLYAQPVPPPNSGPNNGHGLSGNQNGAPLDGGLSVLIFIGAVYGVKELNISRKAKKEKKEESDQ